MTAGTNVARLPEKWRHEDPPHGYDCECDRCKTYEACAVELEAALSAHGQPVVDDQMVRRAIDGYERWFEEQDLERLAHSTNNFPAAMRAALTAALEGAAP